MGLLLNKEIDSELRQGKSSYNKTVSFFCGSEGWFGEGGAAGLDDRWLGQVGKHINYSQGRQDSRRGRSGGWQKGFIFGFRFIFSKHRHIFIRET